MIEYTITVKNANFKVVERDTLPEPLILDRNNADLQKMIGKVLAEFKKSAFALDESGDPPDISLKATLVF
jgi:hypothetical protein